MIHRHVFRPDLPKAHLDQLTCRIILAMLPLDKVYAAYAPHLSIEQRRALSEQWDLMHTVMNLSRAIDQGVELAPDAVDSSDPDALTAAQAGKVLGVSGKRVRQLATEGVLEKAQAPDNQVWVTRASVVAESARRATQNERNAGQKRSAA